MTAITNLILLLHPHSNDYESCLDNTSFNSVECIHDIRLVWPPETTGDENFHKLASYSCNIVFMGRRLP